MKKNAGFTLIEIMVVVVVVAILAAVAVPFYQDSVLRSRRAQVQTDLLALTQLAERFYTVNTSYADFVLPAGTDVSPTTGGTVYYDVDLVTDARTFTLTATPRDPQTRDRCGTLTINHAGRRTNSTGTVGDRCWQ